MSGKTPRRSNSGKSSLRSEETKEENGFRKQWTDAVKGGKVSRNYKQAQRNTGIARITMSPGTSIVKKKKKNPYSFYPNNSLSTVRDPQCLVPTRS